MGFLTLEDYNSVNLDYINEFYVLDTSRISEDVFDNVLYDFCVCSHSVSGANHTFTFEVQNSLWNGRYYLLKSDDTILNVTASYSDGVITVTSTETSVKLVLYLCSFSPSFNFEKLEYLFSPLDTIIANNEEITGNKTFHVTGVDGTSYEDIAVDLGEGVLSLVKGSSPANYVLCLLKKTDLIFNINQTLQVGIINKVRLNVDDDYLPNGSLAGDELLDIAVKYGNMEIQAYYDELVGDYCFDLDLTAKLDNKPINVEIIINENSLVNPSDVKLILNCSYATADSFNQLISQVVSGAEIIQLTSDIVFDRSVVLPHQVYIIGDGFNVDFGSYGFVVDENVNVRFKDVNFLNGSPCFIQRIGSKLVVDGCSFENARITDECKGSIVYTLNDTNITTELSNSSILNCHHSIYHSGTISVNNIKAFYNNYNESIDHDYPAFLTSYDGQANITNSKFDIDYTDETICTNQTDIKFAQSLIAIGETTIINGYARNQIQSNNSLHLTDTPFNNRCHVYCKYYYPNLETCVITSPKPNYEDKAVCHNIIGEDYIYKNNVQITRADAQTENNNRTLTWED